jgi:hypothetical protein
MSLTDSNTFALPSQGASIAVSRSQFNNSLRALLQSFYSDAIPDADNLTGLGVALTQSEYNGAIFRSSLTGMTYVSDSAIDATRTNNPVGGKFTRYGLAWRQQGNLAAAAANIATFDVGEAFVVVKDTGGPSNNRIYLRVATTGTFGSDFVDVGQPFPGSLTSSDITDASITGAKLAQSLERDSTNLQITSRLTLNSYANNQLANNSAVLELMSSTSTNNVTLGFTNTGTTAFIKMTDGTGTNAGLRVGTLHNTLAPLRSNLIMQTALSGATTDVVAPLVPAGFIGAWISDTCPQGYLFCNGTSHARSAYPALSVQIQNTFNAVASAINFNTPNTAGRAIFGVSSTSSLAGRSLGNTSTNGIFANVAGGNTYTSASDGAMAHSFSNITVADDSNKDTTIHNANVMTALLDHAAHTHTVVVDYPGVVLQYIIKT